MKKQIEVFADSVTSATYDGAEDVDGESLDHYTATVDTDEAAAEPAVRGGRSGGACPTSMTQEWWFDGDGLIRKFSTDFGRLRPPS